MPPLQPPEIGNVTTTQDYDSFCGKDSNCEKFLFEMLKQWYLFLTAFVLILYLIILCPCVRKCIWNNKCCCGLVWFFESTAVNDCFKASPLKCFYIVTREMIDTTEFENGFKNIICSFPNILQRGKEFVITEEMYENTPELIKTSFKDLSGKNKTEEKEKGPPADKHENLNDSGDDDDERKPFLTTSFTQPKPHTKITDKFPVDIAGDSKSLTAIIGEPGSGKTVYMETLRSFYIKEKGLYPFLIPFRGLKNDEKEMTFPEFLFKYRGFSCSKDLFDDKKTFGNWIKNHKSKIIILLDGLDEYQSVIDEGVPRLDMNISATVDKWISLIFKQDQNSFMSGIKVVFTSRPSTILGLSGACRPSVYYKIKGLTSDLSLKSVITCYNSENSDEIFKFVKNNGPNIREFASNPFILALISLLYEETDENKITSETTIPQLYDCAFKQLRRSPHRRGEWNDDQEKIVDGFWYKLFEDKNKLKFTEADFDIHITRCNKARKENGQEKLPVTLADLETFSMIQIQSKFSTDKVEATDKDIEPKHRTIQEFHVARHMKRCLDLKTFMAQVEEMFQNADDDKWKMIREFLTYFINKIEDGEDVSNGEEKNGEKLLKEKKIFFNQNRLPHLSTKFQSLFVEHPSEDDVKHEKQMMVDSMDFGKKLCHEIREKMKDFEFQFKYSDNVLNVPHRKGLCNMLQHVVETIGKLSINISDWNKDQTRDFFQALKSPKQIEDTEITMEPQQHQCFNELVEIFPHFTRMLKFELDGGDGDDRRRFCGKLKGEIFFFDTSKLQTQELKVEVCYGKGRYSTILFEVVIHRGEPLQFAKVDIWGYNDDKIREFFQRMQRSSTTNEDTLIKMDAKQHQYINELVATFPHFTRMLKLLLRGGYDHDGLRFCRKLKGEIIKFDTSKLQTQELKVEVSYITLILLEVVIRRGEPPQFTKVNMIGYKDDEMREFFQTIQRSTSKNEDMLIEMDAKQHQYINELVATFPHLTRKLKLRLEGDGYVQRQFCRKLTEEIINFDTSKLQTQELKVEVVEWNSNWRSPPIFLEVVIRRGEPPQFNKVNILGYKDDEIREFFQTIQRSISKIQDMVIAMDAKQHQYMKELVAIFPNLTGKMYLMLYGDDDDDRRRFYRKLKEEINNFDTSKLQTQELKVEVVDRHSSAPTIFLEVVIRRGEPPQFITQNFN